MSQTVSNQNVAKQMAWRYAVKAFDENAVVSKEVLDELLEVLRLAPSSFGFQPWRFFLVESEELKTSLGNAAPLNKSKIEGASHFLVLARMKTVPQDYIDNYIELMRTSRNQNSEDVAGFHKMVSNKVASMSAAEQSAWTARQVYVALGCVLTAAAMLEVDTCPMEGIDPPAFDKILGLENTNYTTTLGLALGARSKNDKYAQLKKVRFSKENVVEIV